MSLLFATIAVVTAYLVLLFYFNGGFQPKNGPKFYRGWIPFFGDVVTMIREGRGQYVSKRVQKNGGIFSSFIFGKVTTFIADPTVFSGLWKNSKVGFGPFMEEAGNNLRGFKLEEKLSNEEAEIRSEELRKMTVQYLQGEELNTLTIKYQKIADDKIAELTAKNDKFSLLDFARRVVYTASSKALLDPIFDSDACLDDFFYFDENATLLIAGLPGIFTKKISQARERVIEYIKKCDIDKCSGFIKASSQGTIDHGFAKHVPYTMMNFLFASQTNSVNSSFWLFLYVLKHPHIQEQILGEIKTIYDKNDVKTLEKMETLSNAFWEASRLAQNHISIRETLEDCEIKIQGVEYTIPKASLIMMSPTTLLDEKFWENPTQFQPDRHKNPSKQAKQAFIPFGGGKHLCPGRYFAINEAKLFVISMLTQFDCKLEDAPIPTPKTSGGGAFMFPTHDISFNITKRTGIAQ